LGLFWCWFGLLRPRRRLYGWLWIGRGDKKIDAITGGFGGGECLMDGADHLSDGWAGWGGFTCDAEKAGKE
jgi:hypothetical protein